jgi:glycosyltransferase involved in cell wall biosynthesis
MTLGERLSGQGFEQIIFALPSPSGSALADPMRLVRYADGSLFRLFNVSLPFGLGRQIAALMLLFKPDVVHLHGGWHPVLFFGACVARRMGIPILLSLHGSLRPAVVEGDRRLKKRFAWNLYQRRLVQMSSLIHVSTESEKEDLVRLGFTKPVAVIPNGVDIEDFSHKGAKTQRGDEADGERSAFFERINVSKCDGSFASDDAAAPHELSRDAACTRTVLYLGRLHPLKGLDLLITAWKRIAGDYPGWRLLVVGPDEQGTKGRLVAQAVHLGLRVDDKCVHAFMRDCVSTVALNHARDGSQAITQSGNHAPHPDMIFTGPLYGAEKLQALASADLFVLPTRSENFGIAVAEALAAGVPVITTKGAPWAELAGTSEDRGRKTENGGATANDTNGARDQASPDSLTAFSLTAASGRCGWWIDVGVDPLVDALREAMSLTEDERHAMGENGRRLVESKYRWETVAERMSAVYSGIVSGER